MQGRGQGQAGSSSYNLKKHITSGGLPECVSVYLRAFGP